MELPAHGPAVVILAIVGLLLGVASSLRLGNYWASIPFHRKKGRKQSMLVPQWRRPSIILLILLLGYSIYTRSITGWTEMTIVAFFVLRYWERGAYGVDDLQESDVDNARDKVLTANLRPKRRRWYKDVND